MINYTFASERTSVEALKVIVGKRHAYVFDVLDSVLGDLSDGLTSVECYVWIGDRSGCIHIDVTHTNDNGSAIVSNFVLGRGKYNDELCVTLYAYNNDALILYKDIDIPGKNKLTRVAYSCM